MKFSKLLKNLNSSIISFCVGNQPYCLLNIKGQQRRKTINRFKHFNLDGNRAK